MMQEKDGYHIMKTLSSRQRGWNLGHLAGRNLGRRCWPLNG